VSRFAEEVERTLEGGDRRSLGRVDEVVEAVLARPARFDALFHCLFSADEIVRMRAADAIEKVSCSRADLLDPYREPLLSDVAEIEQPSVQWHLAQILPRLELSATQRERAVGLLKRNLQTYDDLFVATHSLEALTWFAEDDPALRAELVPVLREGLTSERKSMAARSRRLLTRLT
jgi:hypothetical protein